MRGKGYASSDRKVSDLTPPEASNRRCDSCNGAMPARQSRQRDEQGRLVCDSCKANPQPQWTTTHAALSVVDASEMQRREAEALASIVRVRKAKHRQAVADDPKSEVYVLTVPGQEGYHPTIQWDEKFGKWTCTDSGGRHGVADSPQRLLRTMKNRLGDGTTMSKQAMRRMAHDSGDQAILNHCPFCGSGAVTGGSDGTTTCDFCHTSFTVQVQPTHPYMPQTVDGQPQHMPGMPEGQETELSAPSDPTVEEDSEDVAADPLGEADPNPPSNPTQSKPPFPPKGQEKSDDEDEDKPKKGNQPPWLKNKRSKVGSKTYIFADSPDPLHCGVCGTALPYGGVDNDPYRPETQGKHVFGECPRGHDEEEFDDFPRWVNKRSSRAGGGLIGQQRTAGSDGWEADYAHPGVWKKRRGKYVLTLWEVAARAGKWQWSGHTEPDFYTFGGGEDWYDSREDAVADAEAALDMRAPKQAFRTADGHTLDADAYMARLALEHADDREAVLDAVRLGHLQKEQADKGLVKHQIKASEIQSGDFLDIGGRTRVADRHPRTDKVLVRTQTRGARSPSVKEWEADQEVTVWRRS